MSGGSSRRYPPE
ncbi:transposase, partial [Mycobacterium tuberculosis MAL020147]